MGTIQFRLVFHHDLTYFVEITMPDRTRKIAKGFANEADNEADAEAWCAEEERKAPVNGGWKRGPMLSWRS
jgi:hypothetical protein